MIHLDEMTVPDGVSDALDSARRGIGAIDRDAIGEAATSAARNVLPNSWFRPKPRRWPLVAVSLLMAALFATVFLMRRPLIATLGVGPGAAPKPDADQTPDASDVVDGPIGSASLRDPASSGPEGADLSRLDEIEIDPEQSEPSPSTAR